MHTYVPPSCTVARQRAAERVREPDVSNDAIAEERAHAVPGAVEELAGHDEIRGFDVFAETPDRAGRQDPLHTELLEPVDVRAEVQLRWLVPMADAVTREKRDASSAKRSQHVGAGRVAERCRKGDVFAIREFGHVVQATSPDDANLCSC
jgi:hypothetical protein